jgi:hypothetical protein
MISSFYGILIEIFWREHGPPHFHALYADHEALIDPRTLVQGSLLKRAFALVLEWASEHRAELMEDRGLCSCMQKVATLSQRRRSVHGRNEASPVSKRYAAFGFASVSTSAPLRWRNLSTRPTGGVLCRAPQQKSVQPDQGCPGRGHTA